KVFERSKQGAQKQTQTIVTGPLNYKDKQFASFYQQASQDKAMRDYAYYPKHSFVPDKASFASTPSDTQTKSEGKKEEAEDKKDGGGEKKDGGGSKSEDGKGGKGGGGSSSGRSSG